MVTTMISKATVITVRSEVLPGKIFARLNRDTSLKYSLYMAPEDLQGAFLHYEIPIIHADKKAKGLLDRMAKVFIANQEAEMKFDDNLKTTFADFDLYVLRHEEGSIIFLASPPNLELLRLIERQTERDEVRDQEIERRGPITSQLPSLGEMDGNVISGPNQSLLTAVLEGKVIPGSIPVRPPRGTTKR